MAKILDILTHPDPILRQKSKEVELEKVKNGNFKALCADMVLTMLKKDGVGLAAPQIGNNIRIVVINTKDGVICFFNPVLTKKSWRKEWGEEGCLSVPNTFGKVNRHKKVTCEFIDQNGNKKTMDANGLMARILQHEIDHLDAVLFIDKAKKIKGIKE